MPKLQTGNEIGYTQTVFTFEDAVKHALDDSCAQYSAGMVEDLRTEHNRLVKMFAALLETLTTKKALDATDLQNIFDSWKFYVTEVLED